jgi:hypothetical protein
MTSLPLNVFNIGVLNIVIYIDLKYTGVTTTKFHCLFIEVTNYYFVYRKKNNIYHGKICTMFN